MMTAKEARNAVEAKRNALEQKLVEEAILKAVDNGKTNCYIRNLDLSDATEKWLTSLGYHVSCVDSTGDSISHFISWDNRSTT